MLVLEVTIRHLMEISHAAAFPAFPLNLFALQIPPQQ